jgi:hypothetical protein
MMKKNLNDWSRPARSSNYLREGWDRSYYDYVFLTEGQKYRYDVLIPSISKVIQKFGLNRFIKLIGGQVLYKTFASYPDELFMIFGEFKKFRVLLHDTQSNNYRTNEADVYYYNTSPLFYVDDKGVMMVDNSLRDLFARYFRMPENYYCRMLEEYGRRRLSENVRFVKFCDLSIKVPKMESMHINYKDVRGVNYSPTHSFRY